MKNGASVKKGNYDTPSLLCGLRRNAYYNAYKIGIVAGTTMKF